jgi:hypothetical protein
MFQPWFLLSMQVMKLGVEWRVFVQGLPRRLPSLLDVPRKRACARPLFGEASCIGMNAKKILIKKDNCRITHPNRHG